MPRPTYSKKASIGDPEAENSALLAKVEALSASVHEIKRAITARGAALRIAKARAKQQDPSWLAELRDQYTEEVRRRTLEINDAFPIRQG